MNKGENLPYEALIVKRVEKVGIVTLNRPEHLNALSTMLFREIDAALTELENDEGVVVVLFTGNGRAFSAGADIHEMVESRPKGEAVNSAVGRGDWMNHLINYKKPTIGAINGLAYGGGALLASCFDIRVGCENTSFRFLAITYGRINATWSLPLIVGIPKAKELLLTGRVVLAEEAYRTGLLNQLVPSIDLMKSALEMAQLIAGNDTGTVQLMRKILNGNIGLNQRDALKNEIKNIADSLKPPPPEESFAEFLNRKSHPPS
jgi:enoyl-CoA hydratase/carnithine racemase